MTFPYRIGRWSKYWLVPFGVRSGHREVEVDEARLVTRFGWVTAEVPLADVERWDITGPYHWFRAIGIRHTLFHQDISFCGDATGALRLHLRSARQVSFVRSVNEVYLGVADLQGLAAHLTAQGIPGEDLRTSA